ncbi:MAG: hypothetical protein ACOC7O_00855 [Thermoplasmatota archaeon]
MAFITKTPIDGRYYWEVRHSYRRRGGNSTNYYIEYLGPVGSEKKGNCPKCGKKKTLYPKYNMCKNCITDLDHIKKKVEKKRRKL